MEEHLRDRPKVIVATARKLAERVYRLLRYGGEYVYQELETYEAAYRARLVKGLQRRASELGSPVRHRSHNRHTLRYVDRHTSGQQSCSRFPSADCVQ
jgi:hypothetical protein